MKYREWQEAKSEIEGKLHDLNKNPPTLSEEHWKAVTEQFHFFLDLFSEAGFVGYLTAIENQYWPEAYEASQRPWYEHHSGLGVVTIGWRKKVISISWDPKVTRQERPFGYVNKVVIETDDNVTHDYQSNRAVIHAWSRDKCLEYLQKLHASMVKYKKEHHV